MKKNTTVAQVLSYMLDLFSSPERWTKGSMARVRKGGLTLDARSDEATCFCLSGGVKRASASYMLRGEVRDQLEISIAKLYPDRPVYVECFNDDKRTTFKHVRKVLEHAHNSAAEKSL